ncbi:MAG: class I SAM-dependent methyltransferase [Betaproteobacteria bacterium]|jgi:SAM-dependent methyltransferase|nr:class I SAM-dependent methyltransferase [Betaproteobacteria bacterium]
MQALQQRWYSANGASMPKRMEVVKDSFSADKAYRLACAGTAMLWQGDFQQARQLLQALTRRASTAPSDKTASLAMPQAFHAHRMAQAQRARILSMLVLQIEGDYTIALRRAPDIRDALRSAWGEMTGQPRVLSLRELLAIVSAYEWQRKGMAVTALGEESFMLHPRYGVFSPMRSEYLDLIAKASLPFTELVFDIGTGTGVIAALLLMRGVKQVVAIDNSEAALRCAQDNFQRWGLSSRVQCVMGDVFPQGQAPLIVCNPPWLPGKATSLLEHAIYDPDSQMLRRFLAGVSDHLTPGGEAWLVLSDLAEHLQLRSRQQLLQWIDEGGLQVLGREDIRPRHPKALDLSDALHAARSQELTSLWRLGVRAA